MKIKIHRVIPLLLLWFSLLAFSVYSIAADKILSLSGVLSNGQCIQCHEKTEANLIVSWRTSLHAKSEPLVDCVACHGTAHDSVAIKARQDQVCIDCHGGAKDPVVHSYSSSKHGVLMKIEATRRDWTKPLAMANYRSPGCAYCHMHAAEHDVSVSVRQDIMQESENVHDVMRAVCMDCHSPRYITRLLENGEAMLEIARKKVREADVLIEQAGSEFTEQQLSPLRQQRLKMQQHLANVGLGAGHQSPDYQWWHGQPALDGDLLRIKGMVSELRKLSVQ
ncbi:MAG: hypothetical protein KAT90_06430 [Gammaproteobacteria bacterium]|nr:hypothetical protein [Gammaproteobacteria bacterium]